MNPSAFPAARVTAVIPVYNRANRIARAVRSIQNQTIGDLVIHVVDDGSKDAIGPVMEKLIKEDPRIHFFRQPQNAGAQAARNRGIREAHSEWIAFLDSDDEWLPDSLERRMKVAAERGVDVVHSGCIKICPDGREVIYADPLEGRVYANVLASAAPMFQGMLVRKRALEKIGLLDEKVKGYQEWDTAIRLARYFNFGYEPKPTFIYDCRGTDTMSINTWQCGEAYRFIVERHFWSILFQAGPGALSRHYQNLADWYRQAGRAVEQSRAERQSRLWKYADLFRGLRKIKRSVLVRHT